MVSRAGNISGNRKKVMVYALSLCGRVMYEWGGGHPTPYAGFNPEWSTTYAGRKSGENIKGLDCSGYVMWVGENALGGGISQYLGPTSSIVANCIQIEKSALKPGDLGTLYNNSASGQNHVAIFVGYDESGNKLWAQAPETGKPVSVYTGDFNYYWTIPYADIEGGDFDGEGQDESNRPEPKKLRAISRIEELVAADIVVTDYCAEGLTAAAIGKPLILWSPDYESFSNTHESYINPGEILSDIRVESTSELMKVLSNIDEYDTTAEKRFAQDYLQKCDGKSAKYLVEYLDEKVKEKLFQRTHS